MCALNCTLKPTGTTNKSVISSFGTELGDITQVKKAQPFAHVLPALVANSVFSAPLLQERRCSWHKEEDLDEW